jgi:hypothetical protein
MPDIEKSGIIPVDCCPGRMMKQTAANLICNSLFLTQKWHYPLFEILKTGYLEGYQGFPDGLIGDLASTLKASLATENRTPVEKDANIFFDDNVS